MPPDARHARGGHDAGLRAAPGAAPSAPPRSSVAVSFGSPASESGVTRLDLDGLLVRHPQAAFLMRITGDSMREAGVHDGDLALVDRALDAAHGQVVIAILDDEFVCRRLHRRGGDVRLQADAGCAEWVPREGEPLQIWGVVTHVIRPLAAAPA
jgi:DNA polymerase V